MTYGVLRYDGSALTTQTTFKDQQYSDSPVVDGRGNMT